MAWNTPGSKGGGSPDDNRSGGWKPRGGGNGGFKLPGPLRDLFEGGLGRWLLALLIVLLALSSFQLVGEQQRGVVLRFGQFSRILQPGPNFKLPWPIESVTKINATQIKTFSTQMPVLTSDENIVNVSVNVQYRIDDPRQYLFGSRNADQVLEQAAQSAVREQVGRSPLNSVLNNRGPLASSSWERLQASLGDYHTGLVVTGLTLPDARPPEEVKPAFDEVNGAQQVRERLINEAQAYAARVVPEARGRAAGIRTAAEGYKESVIARAQGDSDRFTQLQQQYKNAPEVTRKRLWLETVQQVLAGNRKVIGGDGKQLIYVPMDSAQSSAPVAAPAASDSSSLPLLPPSSLPVVRAAAGGDEQAFRNSGRGPRPTGREESDR